MVPGRVAHRAPQHVPVRGNRRRAHRRALAAARWARLAALQGPRRVPPFGRAPAQHGRAVAHRRRVRPRGAHRHQACRGGARDHRGRRGRRRRAEVLQVLRQAPDPRRQLLQLPGPRAERRDSQPAEPALRRRRVRPGAGAVRCQPRAARRRDHRAARHERRGQVDGAARDLRAGRPEAGQHQPPRRRHQRARAAPRRRARPHPGAGRQGRVPVADRRGEPPGRRVDAPTRPGVGQGSHRAGPRALPRPEEPPQRSRRAALGRAAADARARRWRSSPSRRC